jgi:hypothetical protein
VPRSPRELGVGTIVLGLDWNAAHGHVPRLTDFMDALATAGGHPNPNGDHACYDAPTTGGEAELQATLDAVFEDLSR